MNRSKDIGTRGESLVVKWAHLHGYPEARRLALSGAGDIGDVELNRRTMLQIKAGAAAEKASDVQITFWLRATEEQARRGGYDQWFLVTKRAGHGRCDGWWTHMYTGALVPVRFTLSYLPRYVLVTA